MAKRGGGSLFGVSFSSILGFTCISERMMTHDGAVDGKTVLFGEGGFLQLSSGNDSIHSPELETSDVVMSSHGDV